MYLEREGSDEWRSFRSMERTIGRRNSFFALARKCLLQLARQPTDFQCMKLRTWSYMKEQRGKFHYYECDSTALRTRVGCTPYHFSYDYTCISVGSADKSKLSKESGESSSLITAVLASAGY